MDWTNVLFCHSIVVVNGIFRGVNCYTHTWWCCKCVILFYSRFEVDYSCPCAKTQENEDY